MVATLTPFGATKCPAKANVWTGAKWVGLPTARVGSGALRCRVSGTVAAPATAKAGSTFPVLVTANGFWPTVASAKVVAG